MSERLFIILSAGISRGIHPTKECRYLTLLNDESLILRQIRIIKNLYPDSQIHVGLGDCSQTIQAILPKDVHFTICSDYAINNTVSTLKQCLLNEKKYKYTTIICGDIIFNHEAILTLNPEEILLTQQHCKDDDIGVNFTLDKVDLIQYGLNNNDWKFGQVFTFSAYKHQDVLNCLATGNKSKWFLHELINKLSEDYFVVSVRKNKNALLYDFDTTKDLKYIRKELKL